MPAIRFNVGDRVRVKDDEESKSLMNSVSCTTSICNTEDVIKQEPKIFCDELCVMLRCDWTVPVACLELLGTTKPPKKHTRGLRLKTFGLKTYDIKPDKLVPRVPELRALHGVPFVRLVCTNELPKWFTNMVNYAGVEFDTVTKLVTKANGQKMKATKWVSIVGAGETKVQELALALNDKTFDMTLSVSFKDLIRASRSRNFTSCWNTQDIYELLERPNIAIAGTKDKHGDYLSRWVVWWDAGNYRAILNPLPYPQKRVFSNALALTNKVPIFRSDVSSGVPFNISDFYTQRLYGEMYDKSNGFLQQLSLVTSQENNESDNDSVKE